MPKKKTVEEPKVQESTIDPRIERYAPLVSEIYKLITEANPKIGEMTDEERNSIYNPLAQKVLEMFLDGKVNYADRQFVFQLVMQPVDIIKNLVSVSLENHFNTIMRKLLGMDYLDLTVDVMDEKLKG